MHQTITVQSIGDLLDAYPKDRRHTLAALQDMQRQFGYVPREGMEALAIYMACPLSAVYSMATFFKALSLRPKGRHIIRICDGTACHVRGSSGLIDYVRSTLGIRPDETTPDGEFSLELVGCLGVCALAPVMVVDDVYYSKVTQDALPGIFEAVTSSAATADSVTSSASEATTPADTISAASSTSSSAKESEVSRHE